LYSSGHATYASRLHRSQDQAAACLWTRLEDAAIRFTATQIDSLATALLAFNNSSATLPPSLTVAAKPQSDYQPAGKAGKLMTDLACFSCHRNQRPRGDMAPDLTWEGSSVQRQLAGGFPETQTRCGRR